MRRLMYVLQAFLMATALCAVLSGIASAHTAEMKQSSIQQQKQMTAHLYHPNATTVYVWATDVYVRTCTSKSCGPVDQISTTNVADLCQAQGDVVSDAGYTNNWWSYIETPGGVYGWISNIYIKGDAVIAGVPHCS